MRLFLLVAVSFVIILTIYRRIIEPFREGLHGNLKSHNRASQPKRKPQGWMSSTKKEEKKIELNNVEEADFTEIQ